MALCMQGARFKSGRRKQTTPNYPADFLRPRPEFQIVGIRQLCGAGHSMPSFENVLVRSLGVKMLPTIYLDKAELFM